MVIGRPPAETLADELDRNVFLVQNEWRPENEKPN